MAAAVDKALGKRVAELRKAAELTQAQLAEKVGVAVETISRLERGSAIPSLARLEGIARALRVELPDLFAPATNSQALAALVDLLRRHTDEEITMIRDVAVRILRHPHRKGLASASRRRTRK